MHMTAYTYVPDVSVLTFNWITGILSQEFFHGCGFARCLRSSLTKGNGGLSLSLSCFLSVSLISETYLESPDSSITYAFCWVFQLVASLIYADNGAPVEKLKDNAEAPLLTSYEGVEFPSTDRPIKLLNGRASFKLKISQVFIKKILLMWIPCHCNIWSLCMCSFLRKRRHCRSGCVGIQDENIVMMLHFPQVGPWFNDPDHLFPTITGMFCINLPD